MPDGEGKGVPKHRSKVLKGSLPQGPSAHPRNTEDVFKQQAAADYYLTCLYLCIKWFMSIPTLMFPR